MPSTELERIFSTYEGQQREVIPLLQAIQREIGYLPEEALRAVARFTRTPESHVYGVATFYAQFHLVPRGRRLVQVCQGTACHVRGGRRVLEALERELDLRPGETREDLEFTLEVVRCIGCCSLAPVMALNGKAYGRLSSTQAVQTLWRRYEGDRPRGA